MKVKVTKVPGTYTVDATNYGPFEASPDAPFIDVPEGLALALNLPVYDGELPEEGADIQELLDTNHSLKEELDKAQRTSSQLQAKVDEQAKIIEHGTADNQRLTREAGASNDNSFRLKRELDEARAQVADLQAKLEEVDGELSFARLDTEAVRQELQGKLDKAQTEISELNASHAAEKTEWEAQRDSLLIDTAAALEREKGLQADLEAGATADSKPAPAPKKASKP